MRILGCSVMGVIRWTQRIAPVRDGSERGHLDVKTLTKAAFLSAVLLLAAAPAGSAVTEYVVSTGPLITLQDGRTIDGHVVGIDQTNIVVQSDDGVAERLPRSTVRTVTFETAAGGVLTGELVGWASGVYQIATAGRGDQDLQHHADGHRPGRAGGRRRRNRNRSNHNRRIHRRNLDSRSRTPTTCKPPRPRPKTPARAARRRSPP